MKGTEIIAKLNLELEAKAENEYKDGSSKILNCHKCDLPPRHTYDSFGMPMHYLECPLCGIKASFAKRFQGVVDEWNSKQNGTYGKIECFNCKHYFYASDFDTEKEGIGEGWKHLCLHHYGHQRVSLPKNREEYGRTACACMVNGARNCQLYELKGVD